MTNDGLREEVFQDYAAAIQTRIAAYDPGPSPTSATEEYLAGLFQLPSKLGMFCAKLLRLRRDS